MTPWVIAEDSGKIIAGHCDCMAGLGETCSHIASLLFAIESGVRIRDSMTVTQKKAYWVMPNGVKEVQYAPVRDINFLGKKRSAAKLASSDFRASPSPVPSPVTTSPSSSSRASSVTPCPVLSCQSLLCSQHHQLLLGHQSHQLHLKRHRLMMIQWHFLVCWHCASPSRPYYLW